MIRLTRPVGDFAAQTTMPFFWAVPPALPANSEGVGAYPAAPLVPMGFAKEPTLVSKRVDRRCVVLRPSLDLAAVCLK